MKKNLKEILINLFDEEKKSIAIDYKTNMCGISTHQFGNINHHFIKGRLSMINKIEEIIKNN